MIPGRGPLGSVLVLACSWLIAGMVMVQDAPKTEPANPAASQPVATQPVDSAELLRQQAESQAALEELNAARVLAQRGTPATQTTTPFDAPIQPADGTTTAPASRATSGPTTRPNDPEEIRRRALESARRRAEERRRRMAEAASQAATQPGATQPEGGQAEPALEGEQEAPSTQATAPDRGGRRLGGRRTAPPGGMQDHEAQGEAPEGDVTVAPPPAADDGRTEWFSFVDTDWEQVIEHFVKRIGKPRMSDDTEMPVGALTYQSKRRFTKQEAIDELNFLLVSHDYFFAETKDYIYLVPMSELTKRLDLAQIFDSYEAFEAAKLRDYELCSVNIQIKGRKAEEVRDLLSPSMPDYALPIVVGETNKIRIAGLARDVRRFHSLMELIGTAKFDPRETRFIEIKTNVRQIEEMVKQAFKVGGGAAQRVFNRQTRQFENVGGESGDVQVIPDERTKTLILKGDPATLDEIEAFIKRVDAKPDIGEFKTTVVPIEHGNASEIADLLNSIFQQEQGTAQRTVTRTMPGGAQRRPPNQRVQPQPNQQVNPEEILVEDLYERAKKTIRLFANEPTNSLIVYANDEGLARVQEMLKDLDQPSPTNFRTFKLAHADASDLAQMLEPIARAMATSAGRSARTAPTVLPDTGGQALHVVAEREEMEQIAKLVTTFDVETAEDVRHVIQLSRLSASRAAELAAEVLEDKSSAGPRRQPRGGRGGGVVAPTPQLIPIDEAGVLIVFCSEAEWKEVEQMIRLADDQAVSTEPATQFFTIERGNVDAIVRTLQQLYRNYTHPVFGRQNVFVDQVDQQVVVQAIQPVLAEIEALVKSLDQPAADYPLVILPLAHADATQAADYALGLLPESALGPRGGRGGRSGGTTMGLGVVAEPVTNSLILQADKATVERITSFVKDLDQRVAAQQPERRFYPVRNAAPRDVVSAIAEIFGGGGGRGRGGGSRGPVGTQVTAVVIGNQVVVDAPASKQIEVATFIEQLDTSADLGVTTTLIKLPGADVSGIATRLTTAFNDAVRQQGAVARFQADATTETILMTVSKDIRQEAERILAEYTTASSEVVNQVEFVGLQHGVASEMATWLEEQLVTAMTKQLGRAAAQQIKVTPETRTNRVIISAPAVAVTLGKQLLKEYDQPVAVAVEPPAAPVETATRKLPGLDVSGLANLLNQTFNAAPRADKLRFTFGADRLTETLIYTVPKDSLELVNAQIDKFLSESSELAPVQKFMELRNADAAYIAQQLRDILSVRVQQKRGTDVWSRVSIQPETRTNRVVINGPQFVIDMAEALVAQLDVPSSGAAQVQTIALANADASTVQNVLRTIFEEKIRAKTLQITAEPMSNSLIVGGRKEDFEEIQRWTRDLDERAIAGSQVDYIELKYVDANLVAPQVQAVITSLHGAVPGSRSQAMRGFYVSADARTNQLIVAGSAKALEEVRGMVAKIDIDAPDSGTVAIPVQNADVNEIRNMINEIFVNRRRAGQAVQEDIVVSVANGELVVKAPPRRLEAIQKMVAELDATPADELQTKMYSLKVLNAQTVATQVNIFLASLGSSTKRGQMKPAAFAETTTNTLVVIAPSDKVPFIDGLIAQIESMQLPVGEPKTFALKNVRADQVARGVEQMLRAKVAEKEGPRQNSVQVSVLPEPISNRLMIYAPVDYLELAGELVRMIDQEVEPHEIVHIVPLEKADAAQLAQTLMAAQQGKAGGKVAIAADVASNSLLLSGLPRDVAQVEQQVARLDEESANVPELKYFKLEYSSPYDVEDALTAMFPAGKTPADTVTVVGDTYYNRVLVTASHRNMLRVEALISQLDAAPEQAGADVLGDKVIEFFKITKGDPYDIAYDVRSFFPPDTRGGPTIEDDLFSPYIKVICRKSELAKIEELIRKFEAKAKPEFKVTKIRPKAEISKYLEMLRIRNPNLRVDYSDGGEKPPSIVEELWPESDGERPTSEPAGSEAGAKNEPTAGEEDASSQLGRGRASPFKLTAYQQPPAAADDPRSDESRINRALTGALGQTTETGPEEAQVRIEDGAIILSGLKADVDEIEDMIDLFEEDLSAGEVIRIFKFRYGDVNTAARIVDLMFNEQQMRVIQQPGQQPGQQRGGRQQPGGQPGQPGQDDERGGGGQQQAMDLIRSMMGGAGAAGAAGGDRASGRVRIATDASHNYLIVKCDESRLPEIRQLLRELDIQPAQVDVKVFQLKSNSATELANNLKAVLGIDKAARPGAINQPRMPGNAQQQQIMELIQQQMVSMAGGEGGSAKVELVEIVANEITNSVLVSAPADVMKIIEDVIEKLEQLDARDVTVIRTYPLRSAQLDDVVPLLREIFADAAGGAGGRGGPPGRAGSPAELGPVTVSGDPRNNTIIYTCLAKDVEIVEANIRMVDIPGAVAEAEMYICEFGDAAAIADTIQAIYGGGGAAVARPRGGGAAPGGAGGGGGEVRIASDATTNAVLVYAPAGMRKLILSDIQRLDLQSRSDIKEIEVKLANPEKLADKLAQMFGGTAIVPSAGGPGGRGGRIGAGGELSRTPGRLVIVGDKNSGKLLVRAPEALFEQIRDMTARLDTASEQLQVKRYVLHFADASVVVDSVKAALSEYIQAQRLFSPTSDIDMDAFTAVAEPRTNSIIVVGSEQTFGFVDVLLASVDIETPPSQARTLRLFTLAHSNAETVAAAINAFAAGPAGASGAGGGGPPGRRGGMPGLPGGGGATLAGGDRLDVQAVAEPSTNQVLVFGRAPDIDRVELEIISAIETPSRMIVDLPVTMASASQVVNFVQQFLDEQMIRGGAAQGGPTPAQLLPNDASNRIIVRGTPTQIAEVRELVQRFDSKDAMGANVKIVRVPYGMDVATLASDLERSVNEGERNAAQRAGRQPRLVTIVGNEYTNTLVVGGDPAQFGMVETIVEQMGQIRSGQPTMRVVRLSNLSPEEAINLIDALQQRGGATTGTRARTPSFRGTGGAQQPGGSSTPGTLRGNRGGTITPPGGGQPPGARQQPLNRRRQGTPPGGGAAPPPPGTPGGPGAALWPSPDGLLGRPHLSTFVFGPSFATLALPAAGPSQDALVQDSSEGAVRGGDATAQQDAGAGGAGVAAVPQAPPQDEPPVRGGAVEAGGERSATQAAWAEEGSATAPVQPMLRGMTGELRGPVYAAPMGGDQILLSGDEQDIEFVLQMLAMMDQSTEQAQFEVYALENANASVLAPIIEQSLRAFVERKTGGTERLNTFAVIAETTSNALIVSASESNMELVSRLIEHLDVPRPPTGSDMRMVAVSHMLAAEVVAVLKPRLTELYSRRGVPAEQQATLDVVPRSNAVLVIGTPSEINEIERMVGTIDVDVETATQPSEDPWTALQRVVILDLHNANAENLATTLNALIEVERAAGMQAGGAGGAGGATRAGTSFVRKLVFSLAGGEDLPPLDLDKPIVIQFDQGKNSLILRSSEKNLESLTAIAKAFDALPQGTDFEIKSIKLKHANASALATTLQDAFDKARSKALLRPSEGESRPQGVVPPEPTGPAARGLPYAISFTADASSNSLIVVGRKDSVLLAAGLVADLDKSADELDIKLEVIGLRNLQAGQIKEQLDQMLADRLKSLGGDANRARDGAVIAVDERSNSLLVVATSEMFKIVSDLVTELDGSESYTVVGTEFRLLEHADAAKLAGTLQELFDRKKEANDATGIKTKDTVFIIADARSNGLLITGTRDYLEEAGKYVDQLDQGFDPTVEFRVRPLQMGSASTIASELDAMVKKMQEGTDAKAKGTPIHVAGDTFSNSLLLAASKEDMATILRWVELLDKPAEKGRITKIIPLRRGKAEDLQKSAADLFRSGATGGGAGSASDVTVLADVSTNSVIAIGPPAIVNDIESFVSQLNNVDVPYGHVVKTYKLEQADAELAGNLLRSILAGQSGTISSSGSRGTTGGANRGTSSQTQAPPAVLLHEAREGPNGTQMLKGMAAEVTVIDDLRTNSLVVVTPQDTLGLITSLIASIDVPPDEANIRVFPLRNSDATEIATMLSELFQTTAGGAGGRGGATAGGATAGGEERELTFGESSAGGRQALRFTTDTRTNSVVAAGTKGYLDIVEKLVLELDTQPIQDRRTIVYEPRNNTAVAIQEAISQWNEENKQVLNEIGDQLSAQVKASQEILAIPSEDTNRVLISYDPRRESDVINLVRDLDQPPPQVMIQVLILELTMDSTLELGVEFAFQDLQFARAGPTDTTTFDYVGGTDIGAAGSGLGGFTFTITGADFNFLFRTLQANNMLNVLSRPQIVAHNNEEARFEITNDVPYVGQSTITANGQVTTSVERQDVGIILEVTPQINPEGLVRMQISQEVSDFSGSTVSIGPGTTAPIFFRRQAQTVVTVKDGETVVLGGLITQREEAREQKVPLVGDVPLLGLLFSNNVKSNSRTELLLVLTPHVIRTVDDFGEISYIERDRLKELPESFLTSPLMEKLQASPLDLQPRDAGGLLGPYPGADGVESRPADPDVYGPAAPARPGQDAPISGGGAYDVPVRISSSATP